MTEKATTKEAMKRWPHTRYCLNHAGRAKAKQWQAWTVDGQGNPVIIIGLQPNQARITFRKERGHVYATL